MFSYRNILILEQLYLVIYLVFHLNWQVWQIIIFYLNLKIIVVLYIVNLDLKVMIAQNRKRLCYGRGYSIMLYTIWYYKITFISDSLKYGDNLHSIISGSHFHYIRRNKMQRNKYKNPDCTWRKSCWFSTTNKQISKICLGSKRKRKGLAL